MRTDTVRPNKAQIWLSQAYLEEVVPSEGGARIAALAAIPIVGALLLAGLAQASIPLPWTPVPITGQTFGVTLVALLFGARLGGASMALYLGAGFCGAPVFAQATRAADLGASIGYLIGMAAAAMVVGALADRGWARGFWRALGAAYVGSALTFGFGLLVLSFYLPSDALLAAGLLPFLPGDLIKNAGAAAIASRAHRA